jgi:hypothetical protein
VPGLQFAFQPFPSGAVALPTPPQQQVDFPTVSDRGVIGKRLNSFAFNPDRSPFNREVINKSPYKTGGGETLREFIPGLFNGGTRFA